ncbi:hypothetical protein KC363_g104 [Hortaea werneckii]|nr:hypothetical protein KC363_g104 [Hortaea werneckii]
MLICSLTWTKAEPRFSRTCLLSTSSGTFSQSTLNHASSSSRPHRVAAFNSSMYILFSSSPTTSQAMGRLSMNSLRSLVSSCCSLSLKSWVSRRAKRSLRSLVPLNANLNVQRRCLSMTGFMYSSVSAGERFRKWHASSSPRTLRRAIPHSSNSSSEISPVGGTLFGELAFPAVEDIAPFGI